MAINHGECALVMPAGYQGTVTSAHDPKKQWSIIEAATYYELPAILKRVGDWVICTHGLFCLTQNYPIASDRFDKPDWRDHMEEKGWVNLGDFNAALASARTLKQLGYVT